VDTVFLKPGLLSVTFRELSPEAIINETVKAGLRGIEWGGDRHVLLGDTANARHIGQLTRSAGLEVSAYGAYYAFEDLLDPARQENLIGTPLLDTAEALGTNMIRLWPGKIGSAEASADWVDAVVHRTRDLADEAARRDISLGFEYHNDSLTDTAESTLNLLNAIDRPNVSTFWQTNRNGVFGDELDSLDLLKPHITNLHCHHLLPDALPPYAPLADGEAQWMAYLRRLLDPGRTHWVSIEFVKDGSLEAFHADAAALRRWCRELNGLRQ
jgi:3-dehydroshikimate dehydratase